MITGTKIKKERILRRVARQKYSPMLKERAIKESVIQASFELFAQYGIKGISMDMIAQTMGISKRTIYGYFNDKEDLLVEGLSYYSSRMRRLSIAVYRESQSAPETIVLFYKGVMKNPRWYTPMFYDDLRKFELAHKRLEEEKENFNKECLRLCAYGVKGGWFRKDTNYEIVALLAKDLIEMRGVSKKESGYSSAEIHKTMLIAFLRGICTEKGQEIVDLILSRTK